MMCVCGGGGGGGGGGAFNFHDYRIICGHLRSYAEANLIGLVDSLLPL